MEFMARETVLKGCFERFVRNLMDFGQTKTIYIEGTNEKYIIKKERYYG